MKTNMICFLNNKMRYQIMVEIYPVLCEEFENEKKKKDKMFLTFQSRDSNPSFSKICTYN